MLTSSTGTDQARFAGFIQNFHAKEAEERPEIPRTVVDETYRDYVWECLYKQPTVHIGTRVRAKGHGKPTAARPKKKKTSKSVKLSDLIDTVHIIPKEMAAGRSLTSLLEEYGKELRIVLDEDVVRFHIAGTTDDKFAPATVWGALQLVARTRAKAISSLEIGRVLGYDAKTVFYFIKSMLNLGLVAKFQAFENKTSANFVLHRRYWQQNAQWISIQSTQRANEKMRQDNAHVKAGQIEIPIDDGHDEDDQELYRRGDASDVAAVEEQLNNSTHAFRACVPIERQVLEAVKASGTDGMTIAEMASTFNATAYARRHFEEFVHSLDTMSVETGFPDFSVHPIMEKLGRERRLRVRAAPGFMDWAAAQGGMILGERHRALNKLDPRTYAGFTFFPSESGNFMSSAAVSENGGRDNVVNQSSHRPLSVTKKQKMPRPKTPKPGKHFNPVDPETGKPRKGRPRKSDVAARQDDLKRKAETTAGADDIVVSDRPPRKRPKNETAEKREDVTLFPITPPTDFEASLSAVEDGELPRNSTGNPVNTHNLLRAEADAQKFDVISQPSIPVNRNAALSVVTSEYRAEVSAPSSERPGSSVTASKETTVIADSTFANSDTNTIGPSNDVVNSTSPGITTVMKPMLASSSSRQRIDIAAEHRARLVLEVLNEHGGIAEDAYLSGLVEDYLLERQGPEYAHFKQVGDLTDSKTRLRIIKVLIDRGQVKVVQTKALIMSRGTAGKAMRKIVYVATLPQDDLVAFVRQVQEGSHPTYDRLKIDRSNRRPIARRSSIDPDRVVEATSVERTLYTAPLEQLLQDDGTNALFGDLPVARSQPYGYVPGPMSRLQLFHYQIMLRLESYSDGANSGIVCQDTGTIDVQQFFDNLPLHQAVKLKTIDQITPDLQKAMAEDVTKRLPLRLQESPVRSAFSSGDSDVIHRNFTKEFWLPYVILRLAVPVSRCSDGDGQSPAFEEVPYQSSHRLYRFRHSHIDDGAFSHSGKDGSGRMMTADDSRRYWGGLEKAHESQAERMKAYAQSKEFQSPDVQAELVSLANTINNKKRWNEGTVLSKRQMRFLKRFTTWPSDKPPGSVLDDPELLAQVAERSLVPVIVARSFIEREVPGKKRTVRRGRVRKLGEDEASAQEQEHEEGAPGHRRRALRYSHCRREQNVKAAMKTERHTGPVSDQYEHPIRRSKDYNGEDIENQLMPLRERRENEASFLQQVREEQRRKLGEWRHCIDDACVEAGLSDERRAKLEDALSDYRDDHVKGHDALPLEMLRHMIRVTANSNRSSEQYPSVSTRGFMRSRNKQGDSSKDVSTMERKPRARRKAEQMTWSRDADELLRDACVILTARDNARVGGRSNWTPLLQVFPEWTVPRLRQRYQMLADVIGEEAYLTQLEREWTHIWELYRGTSILPDADPFKAEKFDLQVHIQFLRDHIDKDKVLETVEMTAAGESLPASLERLDGNWVPRDATDRRKAVSLMSHDMDSAVTMTRREEAIVQHAITLSNSHLRGVPTECEEAQYADIREKQAECVIKMCIETDRSQWNEEQALALCRSVGEPHIEQACQRMLLEKLIRTEQREGRRVPGRNFTYAERLIREFNNEPLNLNLTGQALDSDHHLRQQLAEGQSLLIEPSNDTGDTIVLANLLCSGEADPAIEVERIGPLRDQLFFNAKPISDCDNEVVILLRKVGGAAGSLVDEGDRVGVVPTPAIEDLIIPWLPLLEDQKAHQDTVWNSLVQKRGRQVTALKDMLLSARETGIPIKTLKHDKLVGSLDVSFWKEILGYGSVAAGHPPLAVLGGYGDLSLIATSYLPQRCVTTLTSASNGASDRQRTWVRPRSWLSIAAEPLEHKWRRGVRQILSHALLRPGITRGLLSELLSKVWDREEIRELVDAAVRTGVVERRYCRVDVDDALRRGLGDDDDDEVCLIPTGRPWYHVAGL